jgi:hypothetical protein
MPRTYIGGGMYHGSVDHDLLAHDFTTDELELTDAIALRIEQGIEQASERAGTCTFCGCPLLDVFGEDTACDCGDVQ